MNEFVTIYVYLVDEAVDVWRPVLAEKMPNSQYRIAQQEHLHEDETWQFSPGDVVVCKDILVSDGSILAAIDLA